MWKSWKHFNFNSEMEMFKSWQCTTASVSVLRGCIRVSVLHLNVFQSFGKKWVLIMEQFLFSDGPRLASFRGMKDDIIPGAMGSNSLAPLTHLAPLKHLHFLILPLKLVSTAVFAHFLFPCALCHSYCAVCWASGQPGQVHFVLPLLFTHSLTWIWRSFLQKKNARFFGSKPV